jgi:hypothetical protein
MGTKVQQDVRQNDTIILKIAGKGLNWIFTVVNGVNQSFLVIPLTDLSRPYQLAVCFIVSPKHYSKKAN